MGRSLARDSKTDFLCQSKYDTMKIPLCLIATSAGYGQTFTASGYVSAYVKDSSKTNSNTAVCIQVQYFSVKAFKYIYCRCMYM